MCVQKTKQAIAQEERDKYTDQFQEYDKKLNEAKDEYQKENPDTATEKPEEFVSSLSGRSFYNMCFRVVFNLRMH